MKHSRGVSQFKGFLIDCVEPPGNSLNGNLCSSVQSGMGTLATLNFDTFNGLFLSKRLKDNGSSFM